MNTLKIKTNCSNCGESELCCGSQVGFINLCRTCVAEFTMIWAKADRIDNGYTPDPKGPTLPPAAGGTASSARIIPMDLAHAA